MLRKRSRPFQKDSSFSCDNVVHKTRGSPFFTVPGLFVGLSTKSMDSDSAKSPTSPLDFKFFSNLSSSFSKSPRSPGFEGQPKSWDCNRVGLGLVDSFKDEKTLASSESKSILLGSQMRIHISNKKTHLSSLKDDIVLATSPKSLPKNYGSSSQTPIDSPKFEIGCIENEDSGPSSFPRSRIFSFGLKNTQLSLSNSLPIPIVDSNGFMGSLSASEIELSEDYTCIISHGPNPKTTHIFGDCILDNDLIRSLDHKNIKNVDAILPSDDFLSYCFSCKKKLEQGEDIYMYRGEKAFCSCNCRDQEILSEEEMGKPATDDSCEYLGSSFHEEIFIS
ncbi:uncharacterized protein A4U43_C01F20310 [Asparagus officinalis]|uniref:FLZ-type domain-containing protein n=1 Tax=Asparagus officinalis TaxID=4686 RepID=A0A5P1FRF4_ASPOF|nr:uncharacterized protein LOC109826385 [Asparagus officinalis]ONK80662.1 uncharacterized protein A4U43_C01F20310 [Asparagus officinalis]